MTGPERLNFVLTTLRAHAADFQRLGVAHMAVFGSVARGEASEESDVDLVIEVIPDRKFSLIDLAGVQCESAGLLGSPVDVLMRRSLRPRLATAVQVEAVNVF